MQNKCVRLTNQSIFLKHFLLLHIPQSTQYAVRLLNKHPIFQSCLSLKSGVSDDEFREVFEYKQ